MQMIQVLKFIVFIFLVMFQSLCACSIDPFHQVMQKQMFYKQFAHNISIRQVPIK